MARMLAAAGARVVLGDVLADVGEHRGVGAAEVGELAEAEAGMLLAGVDHPPGPVQERGGVLQLGLHVDALVAEDRVLVDRQVLEQPEHDVGRNVDGDIARTDGGELGQQQVTNPVAGHGQALDLTNDRWFHDVDPWGKG